MLAWKKLMEHQFSENILSSPEINLKYSEILPISLNPLNPLNPLMIKLNIQKT